MALGNVFLDNADLLFHFEHLYPWEELLPVHYYQEFKGLDAEAKAAKVAEYKKVFRNMLELTGKFLGEMVMPSGPDIDKEGVVDDGVEVRVCDLMERNIDQARKMGCMGVSIPKRYGGLGAPEIVNAMVGEMFSQADTSTMIQWSFYPTPAKLILYFGNDEQKERLIPPLAKGEVSSAVAMTEPDAGSDVGAVRALAVRDGDSWRLTGTKQFISAGLSEMAIVLARSDAESTGLKGLSLFIVPRRLDTGEGRIDNYKVGKPESKLGIHGAPTCELSFSDSRCELLGGEGEGFKEILAFMNEARVGVGMQALGIAQAAYDKAFEYAQTREQMGKPILRHELVADMLLDMDARVKGMRSLVHTAMLHFDFIESTHDILQGEVEPQQKEELEKLHKEHMTRLRELTPLIKYYCAENCIVICRNAIQLHGGYGVMREVGVERLLRDSMATAIYEGTSQIQSLMALKDNFKMIFKDPSAFARRLQKAAGAKVLPRHGVEGAIRDAEWEFLTAIGAILYEVMGKKVGKDLREMRGSGPFAVVEYLRKGRFMKGLNDFSYGLLHAERITSILAQWHILRLLNEDSKIADRLLQEAEATEKKKLIIKAQKDVDTRRKAAQRFAAIMLPDVKKLAAMVRSGDRFTLDYIAGVVAESAPPEPEKKEATKAE